MNEKKRALSSQRILISLCIFMLSVTLLLGQSSQTFARQERSWLPSTPAFWPLVVKDEKTPEQDVTRGVKVATETLSTVGGPEHASLLNVDLADPNVALKVVQANDQVISPNETVSAMANRTHAVAGINGDFFEIHGTNAPINMELIDGELWQSPAALSSNPNDFAVLGINDEGQVSIGQEQFSGSITDGGASHALNAVNRYAVPKSGGLTLVTPHLGDMDVTGDTVVLLKPVTGTHNDSVISVSANLTTLSKLPADQQALVGGGESGQWLQANVHQGDTLSVSQQVTPDSSLKYAVGGGPQLVKNGQIPSTADLNDSSAVNPLTAVGISQDGKHAFFVVFDGHESGPTLSRGLTRSEMAGYLVAHGAYQAILFDGGGSSDMVARLPGQSQVSVINTPSDGSERLVTNSLLIYSTEQQPGPASSVVVNNNQPLTVLTNTSVPVTAYARDQKLNPASDAVQLSVDPSNLASVANGVLNVGATPGDGSLVGTAGAVSSSQPLHVVDHLDKLNITPTDPNLDNGQTQQFQVSGSVNGTSVNLPTSAITWSVEPSTLGAISQDGTFTAATNGSGLVKVAATVGSTSASATVAVGELPKPISTLTDVENWGASDLYLNVNPRPTGAPNPGPHTTSDGSLALSTDVKQSPTDAGSMQLHYHFVPASKVYNLDAYTNDPGQVVIGSNNGQLPSAVGLWIKGGKGMGALNISSYTFKIGFYQGNGNPTNIYPTVQSSDDWQFVKIPLAPTLSFPLRLNYLALVAINPASTLDGDVYFSGLQAFYSPRPVVVNPYQPFPQNPGWLQFVQDPAQFSQDGTTFAAFDDAHTTASTPTGAGTVVLKTIGAQLKGLPANAQPSYIQALGDMSDDGQLPDLQNVKSIMDGFGTPYHIAVGNHEISQGVYPESGNFTSVFGPTHYTYTVGNSRFIVVDSSHIGVLGSDPYQVPNEPQYQWLAQQLESNTSPTVFIATHVPPYDPHPSKDSQFKDGYEAQMFEELAHHYEQTHPGKHVVLLFGHARGFSERRIDDNGIDVRNGIPNFVVADVGAPAYAPADQGGFSHYVLFHIRPDGVVQFAVLPVLDKIEINASATTLQKGQSLQLQATGTTVTGTDLKAVQLPIANPASHVWSSSDKSIATIDAVTGQLKARRPGTVTITCASGLTKANITITVSK